MTAQTPDLLRIDGETYCLYTNPLTPFLAANPGRLPNTGAASTALWRGYIAAWLVRDGRLLLHDVKVPTETDGYESAMAQLFGEPGRQIATWFTGHLIVPTGEMTDYVHMGYGSTYSSYIILTIVEGEVRERRDLSGEQFEAFRRAQWEQFRKTLDYEEDEFLFHYASEAYLSRIFEP